MAGLGRENPAPGGDWLSRVVIIYREISVFPNIPLTSRLPIIPSWNVVGKRAFAQISRLS